MACYYAQRASAALIISEAPSPRFAAACATVAFQNLAMYGTLLALPVALAGASVRSGIALAAFSGGSIILAPLGGRAAETGGAARDHRGRSRDLHAVLLLQSPSPTV